MCEPWLAFLFPQFQQHLRQPRPLASGALGELVAAVQATETAAGANGINVSFDASVIAEVKKLITDFPQIVAQVEAAFGKIK